MRAGRPAAVLLLALSGLTGIGALACHQGGGGAGSGSSHLLAYVSNEKAKTVTVIDTATGWRSCSGRGRAASRPALGERHGELEGDRDDTGRGGGLGRGDGAVGESFIGHQCHHGYPPYKKSSVAAKVHAAYETDLLNQKASAIVDGLNRRIQAWKAAGTHLPAGVQNGKGAAIRVVQLMKETYKLIPPSELVDTYNQGTGPQDRLDRMWAAFGEKTMDSMMAGCLCLAEIWQSAWKLGPAAGVAQAAWGNVSGRIWQSSTTT